MPVSVQGLRQVNKDLLALGAELDDLKDVYAEVAKVGSQVAANLAPHKTGALAATIRGNRAKGKAVVTAGKGRVKYAGAINYGWPRRNIRANRFLQRTDTVMETRAPQIFEQGIDALIEKMGF